MKRNDLALMGAIAAFLLINSCASVYDREFLEVSPEQGAEVSNWAFTPKLVSFRNGFKESFDRPSADIFSLEIDATSYQDKERGSVESLSLDSVVLRLLPSGEVLPCTVWTTTSLSHPSNNLIRLVYNVRDIQRTRGVFIPASVDTICLEFHAVLKSGTLKTEFSHTVAFDSVVVEPDAPERREPVRITMVRHEPKRRVPWPFVWLSQH